jgi:hypothetical protein
MEINNRHAYQRNKIDNHTELQSADPASPNMPGAGVEVYYKNKRFGALLFGVCHH